MRRNIRKDFEAMAEALKSPLAKGDNEKKLNPKTRRQALKSTKMSLVNAFADTGLDVTSVEHWKLLTRILAYAVYGKIGGRQKDWSDSVLKGLYKRIQKLRVEFPKKSELELCKTLKMQRELEQSPETLRRKLQIAKAKFGSGTRRAKPTHKKRRKKEDWG